MVTSAGMETGIEITGITRGETECRRLCRQGVEEEMRSDGVIGAI